MRKKIILLTTLAAATVTASAVVMKVGKGSNINILTAEGCPHDHVEHHDALQPTFYKRGHIEYWCCCDCHTSFSDSEYKNKIENTSGNPTDIDDGRHIDSFGTVVSESAMCSNGISYQTVPMDPPGEFSKVNKVSLDGDRAGDCKYYSDVMVDYYEKLVFGVRCGDSTLYVDGYGYSVSDYSWVIVEVKPLGNYKYNVSFKHEDGDQFHELTFDWKENVGTGYVIGGLNSIMFKAEVYPASATSEFYVTELYGGKATVSGELIDKSAYSSNEITYSTVSLPTPAGFEFVNKINVDPDPNHQPSLHGKTFSDKSLYGYKRVTFAARTSGYYLFESWSKLYDGQDKWITFVLTYNGNETFNLKINDSAGAELYYKENLGCTGAGPVYSPWALNTLLYGLSTEILPSYRSDVEFTVYATEVRGERYEITSDEISPCTYSSNGINYEKTNDLAPYGFKTVNKIEVETDESKSPFLHGKFFDNHPLTDYREVYFAIKTSGYLLFNGWSSYADNKDEWYIFTLVNNGDSTFNLTINDAHQNVVFTYSNLPSTGANPETYTDYALNSILYGNSLVTYPSYHGGILFEVYVTEVRGISSTNLEIVKDSITEYNIVYQANNRYIYNGENPVNMTAVKVLTDALKKSSSLSTISAVKSTNETFTNATKSISIGYTSLLETSGALSDVTLNGGYLIKTVGQSVFIYAEKMNDYITAINDFLEILVGYKYYSASEIHVNYSTSVYLERLTKIGNTSFDKRNKIINPLMLDTDSASALGFDAGYEWKIETSTHGMASKFLNISANESAHPNWYSHGLDRWDQEQYQLCYSAHGSTSEYQNMVDQTSSEIIAEVQESSNAWVLDNSNDPTIIIDLSMQDNWYECNCDYCKAEKAKYGSFSGQQLHFVNDVANKTELWFKANKPNVTRRYKLLAYQQAETAPTSIDFALNEHLQLQFAPVYLDVSKPLEATGDNKEHYDNLVNWISLFKNKGLSEDNFSTWLYSYSTNNIVPVYDYDAFQGTLQTMKKLGIKNVAIEFTDGPELTWFQDLNIYLRAKVMENVDLDLEKTTKDFINNYYGSGAGKIYEFFRATIDNMKNTYTDVRNTVFETHNNKKYWSKTLVKNLISLCESAVEAVENSAESSERKDVLIDRINREKCTAVYMFIEYGYTSILNKKTYKTFFETTCQKLGISKVSVNQTVSDWLSSK